MIIYLLNIFSLLFYYYLYNQAKDKEKIKKVLIFLIILQFTLIQGLRSYNIGSDTQKYIKYYEIIKNGNYSFIELLLSPPLNFEYGYLFLMKVCTILNLSSRSFLILVSFFINYLIGQFIYKESDDFILSFWIFIGIEFFTLSFTMIRQMIAIGLVLNAYIFLKDRKYVYYLLLNILACLFHKTAIVFFIFFAYIIIKDVYKKKKPDFELSINIKFNILILTIFIIIFLFEKLVKFFAHIFYSYYNFSKSDLGFLALIMIFIFVYFLIVEKYGEKTEKILNFEFLIFISCCFQLMTVHISQFSRVALYFYAFTIVSLPYSLTLINNQTIKAFIKYSIYLMTFIQYLLFSMNIYNLVPYTIL